ncbi:D-aminoacyl-tRNA deacylase [Paenibacillus sp.]|uniref:D-aminoacyl-tRNA deacylase n=1 Tax=Paenibacillus sp. TaxID=58172 RepID=UPI002D516AE4|nr:D-aminoacyl-tRNA deacylase [Paenibacillus sp.]HZG56423.1 D-aminoacyl-tRNA deacylase [Paenibacillus sp.]
MRALLQRSKAASVVVAGETVGAIEEGLVVLLGVGQEDGEADAVYLADKIAGLRIFEDEDGKMNRSVLDVGGAVLSVSQFTLYGDTRKGRRPNFMAAARPEAAQALYERFNALLRERGLRVETGRFGEMMDVSLVNWGPVTLWLDSKA